jgi:catechol 2,3-dioxygenase-like lactoylglutathione lyase family enzyme
MDWKLEVVVVPVSDLDRSKSYYADRVGFVVDLDTNAGDHRFVQLTPPGSGCSVQLSVAGSGSAEGMTAGSVRGTVLVVDDVVAARAQLVERGVDVSVVRHFDGTGWVDGAGGRWNSFVFFDDPDGNGWVVQERAADG